LLRFLATGTDAPGDAAGKIPNVLRGEVAQGGEEQRPSQLQALLIVFSLLRSNLPGAGSTCAKGAERGTDMICRNF
jgi:hypothetical protein